MWHVENGRALKVKCVRDSEDDAAVRSLERELTVLTCGAFRFVSVLGSCPLLGAPNYVMPFVTGGASDGLGRRARLRSCARYSRVSRFLDELGELPLDVPPKLLRALADQRIKSVGSNESGNGVGRHNPPYRGTGAVMIPAHAPFVHSRLQSKNRCSHRHAPPTQSPPT